MIKCCPNCQIQKLSIWRSIFLHPTIASECPKCSELYVIPKAGMLYRVSFLIAFLGMACYVFDGIYSPKKVIFWTTPLGVLLGAYISNPVPYKRDARKESLSSIILSWGCLVLSFVIVLLLADRIKL